MGKFQKVELVNWQRLSVFQFFSQFDDQLFSIDFDLTLPEDFVRKCKSKRLTPFLACLYSMAKVLNDIEEFKYRLVNNEVVKYDQIDPVWVEIDKNKNLIIVSCQYHTSLDEFKVSLKNRKIVDADYLKNNPDHFTVSNNHWLNWNSVKHTRLLKNETNQKLVWGKIEGKKVRFSMEVSHLFTDGYHISLFKEAVEKELETLLTPPSSNINNI